MGNGPSKQPDRKADDKGNNNLGKSSFIVDDDDAFEYGVDYQGSRNRTASEGWVTFFKKILFFMKSLGGTIATMNFRAN